MDTKLLDSIRIIIREELKPVYQRLDVIDDRFRDIDDEFKSIDYKFKRQDDKLDAILEAWQIQKIHREERITTIEHRIPHIR